MRAWVQDTWGSSRSFPEPTALERARFAQSLAAFGVFGEAFEGSWGFAVEGLNRLQQGLGL